MNNMNIKDVNGNTQNINLNNINQEMINKATFGAYGRVFTIEGNDFHLTEIVKSLHDGYKNNLTADNVPLLFHAVKICAQAERAGYKGGYESGHKADDYSLMNPLQKMVAQTKHWFSQRTREPYIQGLLNKVSKHISDPTFKDSKEYGEYCEMHLNLALCYLNGIGTKKNEKKGLEHLYIASGISPGGNMEKANIKAQRLISAKYHNKNPSIKGMVDLVLRGRENPDTNPTNTGFDKEFSHKDLSSNESSDSFDDQHIFGLAGDTDIYDTIYKSVTKQPDLKECPPKIAEGIAAYESLQSVCKEMETNAKIVSIKAIIDLNNDINSHDYINLIVDSAKSSLSKEPLDLTLALLIDRLEFISTLSEKSLSHFKESMNWLQGECENNQEFYNFLLNSNKVSWYFENMTLTEAQQIRETIDSFINNNFVSSDNKFPIDQKIAIVDLLRPLSPTQREAVLARMQEEKSKKIDDPQLLIAFVNDEIAKH